MDRTEVANGNELKISLTGNFTFSDSKYFNSVLKNISNSTYKKVIIDLSSVDFIDSAALGILLLTRDKCDKTLTSLVVKNPKGQVRQMFDISRFSDLFKIEQDRAKE
jgi:anti-anti-sigma factor